jgi:hypothetical protein
MFNEGTELCVGVEKNNLTVPLCVIRGDKKGNPVPSGITGYVSRGHKFGSLVLQVGGWMWG